ncbi:alpha/beta fold hydrolase [Microbacterium sp. NEAU-LLC]|uniref:Alpha/beta fold hydrolase n=1 Tax=Microbacterium helvum TaxID=2773713 RepID=A0ABR8NKT5_9MICO|nr:alpha/beta fold hydrolase [Microbacterium helvum]MBD3941280.1 alpha/beta fold hydrolase [Microbacterium helvum]
MNPALSLSSAVVRTAGAISPRLGAAAAMPFFGHVARPRPVTADDSPTMSLARRRTIGIPGIDRRGADVVVYEWGRGPRTVVLAHGWIGRASQFSALVRELVAEGYRVVAFDAPAHGGSPGRHSYLADWLDIFAELQTRHGAFDAIIGHSFGGLATLVGVAGGVDAARVVTISALADADEVLREFQLMLGHSDAVSARLRERFAARYFAGDPDPFAWLSAVRRPLPPDMPLLIAHDEGDRLVPFGEALRIASANPGAALLPTAGFGHNRILAADVVLDAVVDFVTADASDVARTPAPTPESALPAPTPAPAPSEVLVP